MVAAAWSKLGQLWLAGKERGLPLAVFVSQEAFESPKYPIQQLTSLFPMSRQCFKMPEKMKEARVDKSTSVMYINPQTRSKMMETSI